MGARKGEVMAVLEPEPLSDAELEDQRISIGVASDKLTRRFIATIDALKAEVEKKGEWLQAATADRGAYKAKLDAVRELAQGWKGRVNPLDTATDDWVRGRETAFTDAADELQAVLDE